MIASTVCATLHAAAFAGALRYDMIEQLSGDYIFQAFASTHSLSLPPLYTVLEMIFLMAQSLWQRHLRFRVNDAA
eukprot:279219-Amphidinium_carterae.1